MRIILALLFALSGLALGVGQGVRQAQGDVTIKVLIEGKGPITIKLFTKDAPKATSRILQLVRTGFYDGQRFFRVSRTPKPYIAQVGDPGSKNGVDDPSLGSYSTGIRIPYEDSGHSNEKYAVGLAAPLSKDRDSGDCQFYIVLGDGSRFLDGSYTVFGKVVAGFDVVDRLEKGDKISSVTVG